MKILSALFLLILPLAVSSAAPIAYSGKVAVNGVNLDGVAQFKFTLVDHNGSVLWNHADEANASVSVNVERGHYSILLGENMNPIPSGLFLDNSVVYLQVHLNLGDGNFLHLQPDQRIVSAAHALSAVIADSAKVADAVKPGSVTREHLAFELLSDLNATISRSRLSADVLADLNRTIHHSDLSVGLLSDLNATISRSRLSADVLADLNRTIQRTDLASDVLADLNATISRSRLSGDVLADLDRTITREMLPSDVLAELNASVTVSKMHPDLVKYFLPEISNHPGTSSVLKGTGATLSSSASGKFLTYQWQKDGANLVGETNATLVLTDVNGSRTGQYRLVVSNDWGSVSSNVATFFVATDAPLITLEGNASVTHEATTTYVDPGATAVDALNGNLTAAIAVTGSVDENQTGQNQLKYNVSDAGGNAALEKVRTVTVVDTTAPIITLVGDANVSHGLNTAWNDPGATATDSLDGNLSAQISISGTVDVNQTGANVLTYSVSDAAGNSATSVSRTVNVVQPPSGPWNFTNAAATGRTGPTQTQIDASYTGTELEGEVTINTQGIQEWTVPATGTYRIEVWGAGDNTKSSGKGAVMRGNFNLVLNNVLKIAVGQMGETGGGGHGGTFVATSSNQPMIIAGGGGGVTDHINALSNAGVDQNGSDGNLGRGGSNGQGGHSTEFNTYGGGGGGGFNTNGTDGTNYSGKGIAFLNGAFGGDKSSNGANKDGGFGGGGSGMSNNEPAGGGGYSGGGGGGASNNGSVNGSSRFGGGGGSYNSGTSQSNEAGANAGHGKVTITFVAN